MVVIGIVVAAVVAFVLSSTYYALVPTGRADGGTATGGRPAAWQVAVELLRSTLVAWLLAGLLLAAGWGGAGQGALLGAALWVLPVVLLAGSVVWEQVPVRTAASHAGDWLVKLAVVGAIVGAFA